MMDDEASPPQRLGGLITGPGEIDPDTLVPPSVRRLLSVGEIQLTRAAYAKYGRALLIRLHGGTDMTRVVVDD